MKIANLSRMVAFEAVARHLSFTRAAGELGLTKGTVSQHVSALEKDLGLRLLMRTSRKIMLTDAGEDLLPYCLQITEAAHAVTDHSAHETTDLVGRVSITTSHTLAIQYLTEAVTRFQAENPKVAIDLAIRERFVDLHEEGVDLALRVGELQTQDLVARRLGSFSMVVAATPEIASRLGRVEDPSNLSDESWIVISTTNPRPEIVLSNSDGRKRSLTVDARYRTNSGLCALSLVGKGVGLGLLPSFAIAAELRDGRLVNVLPDWSERTGPVSLVWSPLSPRKRRVRAFISFLGEDFPRWLSS